MTAGLNKLSIYNLNNNTIGPRFIENAIKIDISTVCFKEGTKILCHNKPEDKYIPIENLTDNLYVKTHKHGYKKIKYILKSQLLNASERTMNKLYKMSKSPSNKLIEDLYVTGSHAVLKDKLTQKESNKMDKLLDLFKEVDYSRMIDDKYKLVACYDERFEEVDEDKMYCIYHLVLESDNVFQNYGIYANGILMESTDELTLHKMNDFKVINYGNKTNTHINVNTTYGDNVIMISKLHKKHNEYDANAIMKKKKYLEDEKLKRDTKETVITSTHNKTYKKVKTTIKHTTTYKICK